jgi:hypothetical protein
MNEHQPTPQSEMEARLASLEWGFHNCRLEGREVPEADKEELREWIRQGVSEDEMVRRICESDSKPTL